MKNDKAYQKNQLVCEFGILTQPFEDLARASAPPSVDDYRLAIAKVQAGDPTWRQQVKSFAAFAPDIFFNQEYQDISHVPERCWLRLRAIINDPASQNDSLALKERFDQEIAEARRSFFEFVERIPIQWEPVVFQANTPFTSYLRIKEALVSVQKRLHYYDRYLKMDFFALFLESVNRDVSIRLVTTAGNARYGVASVSAVSRLAGQEFSDFQLIEVAPADLHDRNLRVDDKMFSLGSGVDRAGISLTNFGPSDSSDEAHREFDRIIAGGRVVA